MYSNINIHVKCGAYHRIEDYIIQELLTTMKKNHGKSMYAFIFYSIEFHNNSIIMYAL